MPSSLNCPTCGAAAAGADAVRCDYCGSALVSVACPACLGAMFAGMQFCPHCGAKGTRAVDDGVTMSCPACPREMHHVHVGATAFFECTGCAGTWVDAAAFTTLCSNREERGALAAMLGTVNLRGPEAVKPAAVRYISCPLCKRMMNRENFGRQSGVIIDVCKGHGVWFDARELQAVMAFIESGGMERARAREIEMQKANERLDRIRHSDNGTSGEDSLHSTHVVIVHDQSPARTPSLVEEALRMLFS